MVIEKKITVRNVRSEILRLFAVPVDVLVPVLILFPEDDVGVALESDPPVIVGLADSNAPADCTLPVTKPDCPAVHVAI